MGEFSSLKWYCAEGRQQACRAWFGLNLPDLLKPHVPALPCCVHALPQAGHCHPVPRTEALPGGAAGAWEVGPCVLCNMLLWQVPLLLTIAMLARAPSCLHSSHPSSPAAALAAPLPPLHLHRCARRWRRPARAAKTLSHALCWRRCWRCPPCPATATTCAASTSQRSRASSSSGGRAVGRGFDATIRFAACLL